MNDKVSDLLRYLSTLSFVCSLMQVGVNGSDSKSSGKIDILLLCRQGFDRSFTRLKIALSERRIDYISLDDAAIFSLGEAEITLAVRNAREALRSTKMMAAGKGILGEKRPWAVGYFLPEGWFADMLFSKILHDPDGIAKSIKLISAEYPSGFFQAIESACSDELRWKINKLRKLTVLTDDLVLGLLRSDIAAALVRFAFAKNRSYLMGFAKIHIAADFSEEAKNICLLAKRILVVRNEQLFDTLDIIEKEIER